MNNKIILLLAALFLSCSNNPTSVKTNQTTIDRDPKIVGQWKAGNRSVIDFKDNGQLLKITPNVNTISGLTWKTSADTLFIKWGHDTIDWGNHQIEIREDTTLQVQFYRIQSDTLFLQDHLKYPYGNSSSYIKCKGDCF